VTTARALTRYGIESTLMELFLLRDSVLDDPEMLPQDQRDSVQAIDGQIAEYVRAEIAKVDRIAGCLREFETRAAALKAEAKRCADLAKAWEKRHEDLESMVIGIMQQIGKTRMDGRHSVLSLRKNPPSVEVAQLDMVPNPLMRISVTMPYDLWDALCLKSPQLAACKTSAPEPMKTEIAKRLKEGDGVPGCRLRTDGVRLEIR
jgi:hypothetical protein